ncbi:MAG TPA: DUF1592 domain-containing protein, partial [Verrucomicrobiae bacterium]|nr:DUF1592 domain-containing protein [Verrucomicrobiae bacterium]
AVLWRNPGLRFRKRGDGASGKKTAVTPLAQVVSVETEKRLQFGRTASGEHIDTNDFLTLGALVLPIKFAIPAGMAQAELLLDAELDLAKGEDCVVRCIVSHELNEGATVAAISTFSGLLANPSGPEIETLKAGVSEFARKLPQISQREAAPADRDPIPPPFDSGYNNTERNDFHAFVKYHRDDQFLTEHILDDPTRSELDREWVDLLTSFEYHNTILRFVAKKYHLDLGSRKIASVGQDWIESLPEEPRRFVKELREGHASAQRMLQAAEPGHLRDAMRFARLAWRRPLNEAEEERLKNFYRGLREKGINHEESMRALLARILVAPAFLYRMEAPRLSVTRSGHEVANAVGSRGWMALSNWELANRLSYFLWSSIPDAELSRAAERGELEKTEELSRQAKRMLRDPKARRFATEFFGQWFGFYRFDGYRGVDTARFKEFTENLKSSMYDEAVSFFEYIVREDRPVQEILFADYSFLNRDLAAHYGIEGAATPPTNALARIEGVNRFHRGGLLSLGAVLTTTSAPLRTSAVKRGDWMLRRVLGKSIPPPPGDAGSIPPDDVLPDGKTVRQRLEAHRRDASCVNCHSRIDPLGFALEHFDSIGRWRDTYRDGQIIDASGKLSDGTEISEFEGLIEYLHQQEGLFDRTLCAKLLGYALGRAELISDRPLLDRMTGGLRSDSRFSRLVTEIVTSSQFRYQRGEESEGAQSKKVADFRAQ